MVQWHSSKPESLEENIESKEEAYARARELADLTWWHADHQRLSEAVRNWLDLLRFVKFQP